MPKHFARQLRTNMTDAERHLWQRLRQKQIGGARFRRQAPMGSYVVDFVCHESKLIIEVDGGQHADRIDDDATRTIRLESRGYRVLRFWNNDIFENLDGVLTVIQAALRSATPPPQPSPARGEGVGRTSTMTDDNDLPEGSREKLIRAKEQWARDGRLLTGHAGANRLPPGQHLVKDWPVLDIGIQPAVSRDEWRLTIDGAVENPIRWNWRDYMSQLQSKLVTDIHCVTAWSRYDNNWDGVLAQTILAEVRPKADARHVIFHSHDSYTTNVTLEDFAAPDVIVAHSWEGQPLSTAHGGPVRIILPRRYLWKSAKWVRRIEFSATDKPGFWENRGYHNEADPWREERYS